MAQPNTRWMLRLIRQFGGSVERTGDFKRDRENVRKELDKLIGERQIESLHQAILLDEAQDYLPEEIELIFRIAHQVIAAADSQQKIYDGADPLEELKKRVDSVHTLRFHYRNGLQMCRLADSLGKKLHQHSSMESCCNYDESASPSEVTVRKCADLDEQCAIMAQRIVTQLQAYPEELIGIICPANEDMNRIASYFNRSVLSPKILVLASEGDWERLKEGRRVVISTLHSSKGLEFRALHLAACDRIKSFSMQRNMAYMAVTRAKSSLTIYHIGDLPGYFEEALASLARPPDLPDIDEVFGIGDK